MDEKCIQLVSKKMKPDEVLLDIININYFSTSGSKHENKLGMTSQNFYLINNNHIKKCISIADIKMVTISAYSPEIVLHSDQDDIRISSFQNAKIFKNILKVREKVIKTTEELTVLLQKDKHLGKYAGQDQKKKGFLSGLFSKTMNEVRRSTLSSSRKSYCKLMVNDKTFLKEISHCIYACHMEDVQLLYISGMYNFFFDQNDYTRQIINDRTCLFYNKSNKEIFILRKIAKVKESSSKPIREFIENYKLVNNQEEILYATESKNDFEIICPYNREQATVQGLISIGRVIKEIDLVSIFYKLMALIDGQKHILCSLQPRHIIIKDRIVISSVFCVNPQKVNVNYLAPEELDPDLLEPNPELINLWKVGVLLYEIAFCATPFPIEQLAHTMMHNKPLKIYFPQSTRSSQFKDFLFQILQVNSITRGGGSDWKQKLFNHKWIKKTTK